MRGAAAGYAELSMWPITVFIIAVPPNASGIDLRDFPGDGGRGRGRLPIDFGFKIAHESPDAGAATKSLRPEPFRRS